MKTEALPEIIEIIDDGLDPFGDRVQHTTIRDSGGPRWVGPVAAVALIALISYGVATSTSTGGAPKTAPVPTTIAVAPPTTQSTAATTVPQLLVPYYAADPAPEFAVQYAEYQEVDNRSYLGTGDYQLWATPGATATSGRWFSIQSLRPGPQPLYAPDAYRVQNGDQSMAISHTAVGQSVAQFSVNGLMTLSITSLGLDDDALVRLAQSVITDEGSGVHLSDPSLIPDYELIGTVHPWFAVQGLPVEQVYYATSSNSIDGFTVAVAPRPPVDLAGTDADRQIALRFFLDHSTPFEVDGYPAVAGTIVGQPDQTIATWIAGDNIISVSATLPVQQVISLARTVHQVSSDEWSGMRFQAASSDHDLGTDFQSTVAVTVSSGTDADGEPWTIKVGVATFSNRQEVDWSWRPSGFGSLTDGTARINTVVDGTRTYVLAELPRAIAPTAQLLIAGIDREPVAMQFVDVDPVFDQTFAAYAFSEPGLYTARIVGADGAVLARWQSA
jgi:hypothetical protein